MAWLLVPSGVYAGLKARALERAWRLALRKTREGRREGLRQPGCSRSFRYKGAAGGIVATAYR